MITYAIFRVLERRGVDRYTIMTWRSRLLSRHHQAVLETAVVIAVLVLVLLFATVAVGSAQGAGAVSQPPQASATSPAAAMAGMMEKCQARHATQAAEIKALAKTVAAARVTRDVALLHAALDAVAAHLTAMETHAAGCAEKMKGAEHMKGKAPADDPTKPHAH